MLARGGESRRVGGRGADDLAAAVGTGAGETGGDRARKIGAGGGVVVVAEHDLIADQDQRHGRWVDAEVVAGELERVGVGGAVGELDPIEDDARIACGKALQEAERAGAVRTCGRVEDADDDARGRGRARGWLCMRGQWRAGRKAHCS